MSVLIYTCTHTYTSTGIQIYTHIYCVYFGSMFSLRHVSFSDLDKFCLFIFNRICSNELFSGGIKRREKITVLIHIIFIPSTFNINTMSSSGRVFEIEMQCSLFPKTIYIHLKDMVLCVEWGCLIFVPCSVCLCCSGGN